MSSMFGKKLKISVFGQSHSDGIGVVIDGLPPGVEVDMDALSAFMARRAPGNASFATKRKEADAPKFLSGLFDGKTCGAPLCAVIENTNTRSQDYDNLKVTPRPAHADYTAEIKYKGFQDYSGGGHFSGRLTAGIVAAGAICLDALKKKNIWKEFFVFFALADRQAAQVKGQYGRRHQQHILGLTPGVKQQAKQKQHGILQPPRRQKIAQNHCRQEIIKKRNTGKDHKTLLNGQQQKRSPIN